MYSFMYDSNSTLPLPLSRLLGKVTTTSMAWTRFIYNSLLVKTSVDTLFCLYCMASSNGSLTLSPSLR